MIDNLNRAERLLIIKNPQAWIDMRRLRNKLVHEYIEDLDEMVDALGKARAMVPLLHDAYHAVREKALTTLKLELSEIHVDIPK